MSYDFSLTQAKPRKQASRATVDRVARAVEILRQQEAGIVIEPNANGVTALSQHLGAVDITPDAIRLSLSMGSDPHALYRKIHGLMTLFAGEGYLAVDPQLSGGSVDYHPDFAVFMAQYHEHFQYSDAEFAQWCRGVNPQEPRAAHSRADYERLAGQLPRGVPLHHAEQRALSTDALWDHLQDIIKQNDAAIAALGLRPYFDMLAAELQARSPCYRPPRGIPGRWHESMFMVPWYHGTLLHYEAQTLTLLWYRKHPAALAMCPQRYTLSTPTPEGRTPDDWKALIQRITPRLCEQSLLHRPPQPLVLGYSPSVTFDGDDADAIHRIAWPIVTTSTRRIQATLRRGIDGAPEDVVVHAGAG